MRRTVLAATVTAVLGALAVPSFATTEPPVGVTYSVKDGLYVGTTVNGQPGASVASDGGLTCVGLSYQVPHCVDTGSITR